MAEVEIKTLRFHVTCVYPNKPEDERKKILKLDDPRCYKERIISLFSLRADGDYKILSYVEEFDDWVDIDDWSELPDTRGKLKIIVRTERQDDETAEDNTFISPVSTGSTKKLSLSQRKRSQRQQQQSQMAVELEAEPHNRSGEEGRNEEQMSDDDDFMSVQTGGGGSMKPSVTSHGRSQRKRELEQTASAQVEPDDIRTALIQKVEGRDAGSVCGIALVSGKLYVLHYADKDQIDIYSVPDLVRLDALSVPARKDDLWDITSCAVHKCLYVSNKGERCLLRMKVEDEQTRRVKWTKWRVGKSPFGLSIIQANCNILVTCRVDGCLIQLDPQGNTVPESCIHPLHAFQLDDGNYLVSHGYARNSTHRVCKVTPKGKEIGSYGGTKGGGPDKLNEPCHMALERNGLYVADFNNGRMVKLNPALLFVRNVTRDVKGRDKETGHRFQRLCLDYESKKLYIGDYIGNVTIINIKSGR